jgi:CRISPR-associated protein Cas1
MKTRYIFSAGDIRRKDNSIVLKTKEGYEYIPIKRVKELYFMNEVNVNTKLLSICSKYGVILHFFGYYGNYIGTFAPRKKYVSGNVTLNQALAFNDSNKRVYIASRVVFAINENILEIVYHYYRHSKNINLKKFIDFLRENKKRILDAKRIETLFFIEGSIWNGFYDTFKYFLSEDFIMENRVKRPPNNPINAMISFGNTLLYTKTISQLFMTHLDLSISYLHSPMDGRFSLALDISEAFKPIIVFKTIFKLINKKMIKPSHFRTDLNSALLNEEGRKIFIREFENNINKTFFHKKLKRNISYLNAIRFDGYKLIKYLLNNKDFYFFSVKEKL